MNAQMALERTYLAFRMFNSKNLELLYIASTCRVGLRNILPQCRKLKLPKSPVYNKIRRLEATYSPLTVTVPHAASLGLTNYIVKVKPVKGRECACMDRISVFPIWREMVMTATLDISVNFMIPKDLAFRLLELLQKMECEWLLAEHIVYEVGETNYLFPNPSFYNPYTKSSKHDFQGVIKLISKCMYWNSNTLGAVGRISRAPKAIALGLYEPLGSSSEMGV